jgi:hypothetical protein
VPRTLLRTLGFGSILTCPGTPSRNDRFLRFAASTPRRLLTSAIARAVIPASTRAKLEARPAPNAKTAKTEAPLRVCLFDLMRPRRALTGAGRMRQEGPRWLVARASGTRNYAQQHGVLIRSTVYLSVKTRIDDLPLVRVSTLVANGYIGRDAMTALVRFADDGVEYVVSVRIRPFPNGGFWAMFVCPRCDGGAQRLRLLEDTPACGKCVRATGLRYRVESTPTKDRHLLTAPKRIDRLNRDKPARVNPRPGRKLDRRAPIEAALKRSLLVARQRGVAEFEKKLVDP